LNGLQRISLLNARQPPFQAPYFAMASRAYWEQVGEKRQRAGNSGDMAFW